MSVVDRNYIQHLIAELKKTEHELCKLKSKTAQVKRIAVEEKEKAKGGKFFHPFYIIEKIFKEGDAN